MPRGVGAYAGEYPVQDYRTVKNKKLAEMDADIKAVVDSLISLTNRNSFYRILVEYISRDLIDFCVRVLSEAVKRCPYETGELRSSGQVNFYLGSGRTSTLVADTDADASGNFTVNKLTDSIRQVSNRIEAEISFERTDKGIDIALWTHEDLLPWVPRPKGASQKGKWYARQPGTGPKYLESAVNENRFRVSSLMEKATKRAIQEYNRRHGTRTRRGRR
jgi:hypothetical protein